MTDMPDNDFNPEEVVREISNGVQQLRLAGRYDLLLRALGGRLLEELKTEQAKAQLCPLVITADYRFLLPSYNCEVELSPVHKAVYMLFLNHPDGIELKRLADYKDELYGLYKKTANRLDLSKIEDSVERLTNPLDNAINEKCSRIKKAFLDIMDEYVASYYIISSHVRRPVAGSSTMWYRRLKVIKLSRDFVVYEK